MKIQTTTKIIQSVRLSLYVTFPNKNHSVDTRTITLVKKIKKKLIAKENIRKKSLRI